MEARDETARFEYAKWLPLYEIEKPFLILSNLKSNNGQYRSSNLELEKGGSQIVKDIRGQENHFSLDSHGFQICLHSWDMEDWYSTDDIERRYFPEVEMLLRREIGGIKKIHIFDWRIRRNEAYEKAGIETIDLNNNAQYLLPVTAAHIDQTATSSLARLKKHMGDQAQALLQGRVRLINIWRPIKHAVRDWPLAWCDGSNITQSDLLAVDHVTRGYVGETYNLMFRDKYKWYYLNEQRPEEVALFKIFDSKDGVSARCKVSERHGEPI